MPKPDPEADPKPVPLRIFRDAFGDLRAEAPGREGLAAFLESEVQGSAAVAREVLEEVARVAAGDLDRLDWTGNALGLEATREWVRITDEIDPAAPSQRWPLAELRAALEAWLRVLESEPPRPEG